MRTQRRTGSKPHIDKAPCFSPDDFDAHILDRSDNENLSGCYPTAKIIFALAPGVFLFAIYAAHVPRCSGDYHSAITIGAVMKIAGC
jgi:hypothetical protein